MISIFQISNLTCRYHDNGHPLLRLQPAKEEIISEVPFVAVYHDVFSKTLMYIIKEQSKIHVRLCLK